MRTLSSVTATASASTSALLLAWIVTAPVSVSAAIVTVANFRLGETGSLVAPDNRPVDSLSTDTFAFGIAGGGSVVSSAVGIGSTQAVNLGPGIQGWYGVSGNGVFGSGTLGGSPDNFAVELLVNPVANQADNVFFTGTGNTLAGTNGLLFEIRNGNWSVAVPGVDYIGAISGTGQPALPGWTSLAVIRSNGISTLYINGVAQPRTTGAQPTMNTALHLGVTPGGVSWFQGGMDELRVFTFNPATDNPTAFLTAVPEPTTTTMVLGLAALGLVSRRRRNA